MSALDSRYAENSRLKNSSVSTVGLPAFKEQMDAMRQAMVKRKSASETLGYMLHLVGHNAGGAENKAEPEKKATAKDISKPVADRPPESRAGTTMPLHPFADLKHGQLLPVRKLNRMSYPSDKAQRDSIHGALDYRRENAKAPDFKNDLWRFRQRLNPLRDNRLKAEVSLLGEGFMTVYPEGMHDRALRLEHGLPAESPEGRKDAPVLTIGPKAAPSRYYGAAGEAMWGHLPASGKVKVRAALKKMSRHLNQVAGHESVHATQKVMPYDRRGLGGRTRGLVPNETLPPGFKRQLFRDSRQSPDASAERRRAIGEEEFEASAQELKTRLYHMGVDPYEDGAQAKVMDILKGDRADELYPGYFKGMSDKEIEAMAPTLMHVIRGVADNKPQQVDDPMSGVFDGLMRAAASVPVEGIPTDNRWRSGSSDVMKVRGDVLKALLQARSSLPKGYDIKLLDAERTKADQRKLVRSVAEELKKSNPGNWRELLDTYTGGYGELKLKVDDISHMNHRSGRAVDLTLLKDGVEVDMGLDAKGNAVMGDRDRLDNVKSGPVGTNRRKLATALASRGFENYLGEWWHWGLKKPDNQRERA